MEQLWTILLVLKDKVTGFSEELKFCCFRKDDERVVLLNTLPEKDSGSYILILLEALIDPQPFGACFRLENTTTINLLHGTCLSGPEIDFLKTYLPYCFLSRLSFKHQRTISVAHFAQSLDGKIATELGGSQWIGNEENLDHAHRMRALCDAIMIGRNTLENDHPKLTVRRVKGRHPKRVVIASPENNFSSLLNSHSAPVIVIGKTTSEQNGRILYHQLDAENGCIKSDDILACLYREGIKTVYIEGGAITTSNFIKDGSLDVLQLHLSPYLFGSGKPSIVLPGIQDVRDCVRFRNFSFHKIGDTLMFVGEPV